MKLIYGKGEEDFIECDKAVKGEDYIKCYEGGTEIASFEGISDFDGYTLEGGEWSEPQPSEVDLLKQRLEEQDNMILALTETLAEMEGGES